MAINWTPARLEVDLNYKSKDIILASEWNNLWKETRLQGNNNTDGIVLLIETVEGNIGHLTNLDNLFADLESKVTAHTGNSDIHVTSTQKTAWTAKYDKPSGGIPKSDLASSVQSSLDKADSALQQHQDISALTAHVANSDIHVTTTQKAAWTAKYDKPAEGVPKTDLASAVQASLNKADTALQEHQDISELTNHVANNNIHVTSEQKTVWSAKYDKPTSGIPKTDLASAVQTSLGKADTALQEHQDISALTNHVANNNIHVTADDKTAWSAKYNKPSSGIPKTDLASDVQSSLVPAASSSDAGKTLTVSSSGDTVWAEATASGSSGAELYLVVFNSADMANWTADKTYAEILAAHEAGKLVRCSVVGIAFGQLVTVGDGELLFTADVFEGQLSAIYLFTVNSSNNVSLRIIEYSSSNANTELFNISVSENRGTGELVSDKTFDEILAAYNDNKILKLYLYGSGGIFDSYLSSANRFRFVVPTARSIVYITPSAITVEDSYLYLPFADALNEGNILTVDSSGNPAWAEATPSGSSGADVFLVTITRASGSTSEFLSFTADKTYTEIVAAHEAGKIVVCSVLGSMFGQLVRVSGSYVVFGVDYLSPSSSSSKYVFTIYTDDSIEFTSLYFYAPVFLQRVISANAWSNGIYSFESDFDNMYYDIEVELNSTATSEQLDSWISAKPTAVFGTNTMKALGDVPTVDIPVIVKVLSNLKMQKNGGQQ